MKKFIITTSVLLIAAVAITVVYFKHLNTPAARTARVMQSIPNTAALVFEFNNDDGFYDIFAGNPLLLDITGEDHMNELATLRKKLLQAPLLKDFFTGQHIYVSLRGDARDSVDFLLTISGGETFSINHLDELAKQTDTDMFIRPVKLGAKDAYNIYFKDLKRRFYLVNLGNHIFSGSFSKALALESAQYQPAKSKQDFLQIPDQQNSNSLANLYINYAQLSPLFDQFFAAKNTSVFRTIRMLPALASLTLNFKTDALMFNGITTILHNQPASYLTLFHNQQPIAGNLKDIFPSTTALSISFALSDVKKFRDNLNKFHINAGLTADKNNLFNKIKSETGIALNTEFGNLLTGEFAILTTKFDEKFGIVALNNGSAMRPLMVDISKMVNDDVGQFKYDKIPYYLLGDAFNVFTHPYFMILDNYLIIANSTNELASYKDTYQNHKFLTKTAGYTEFDNLLAARSNVAFFLHFRNIFPILKRDLKPTFSPLFNPENKTGNKFYALSWQFSAADGEFYTNFYMRLAKSDSLTTNN